jgi:hypothetical protein
MGLGLGKGMSSSFELTKSAQQSKLSTQIEHTLSGQKVGSSCLWPKPGHKQKKCGCEKCGTPGSCWCSCIGVRQDIT